MSSYLSRAVLILQGTGIPTIAEAAQGMLRTKPCQQGVGFIASAVYLDDQ